MTEKKKRALPKSRCTAKSVNTQERCKNPAIPGGNVCRFHGGNAPQTRKRAALRLLELVDPAIGTLAREMVKAEKSNDRQRAANSILDRAGITRGQNAEIDAARALLVEGLLRVKAAVDAGHAPRGIAAAATDAGEMVAEIVADDDAKPKAAARAKTAKKKKG